MKKTTTTTTTTAKPLVARAGTGDGVVGGDKKDGGSPATATATAAAGLAEDVTEGVAGVFQTIGSTFGMGKQDSDVTTTTTTVGEEGSASAIEAGSLDRNGGDAHADGTPQLKGSTVPAGHRQGGWCFIGL